MPVESNATADNIGEFGLIELLRQTLPPAPSPALRVDIGDDAAVWQPAAGRELVLTTDSLVEEIHFRLEWTDWRSLGHKALAVNLSDLAAMGATPRLALVTLGLRGTELLGDLVALYQGLGALAAQTGTVIAGGDIVRSPHALLIHITVIGDAPKGESLTRAAARPGDVIAVSGTIGASAAGMRLLEQGVTESDSEPATGAALIAAHLRPEPRLALGQLLREGGATSAMDLSDGLLGDLPKILSASGVAAEIDATSLPVAAAVRALFPDQWLELATRGGEDYELLFTLPPAAVEQVRRTSERIGATITPIGHLGHRQPDQPALILRGPDGQPLSISAGAFDHFQRRVDS